jgi:Spy/CpxP family protein refolding chaperone
MAGRLLVIVLVLGSALAQAQQELIELARQDIRAGRMGMIIASMKLTEEQQQKFWPIYREYADEQERLLDKRIALLQEFSGSWDSMTDSEATSLAKKSFAIQRERLERRERYFRRFSKALGPALAARFIQVDGQISTLLDFEMARNTPLIEVRVSEAVNKK